ncbi:MAG: hypothetical protein M0Z75_01725 [Nitrospiraceae bacterium]|nr:hypothetical protein [Nitrospiraceae bacterium]
MKRKILFILIVIAINLIVATGYFANARSAESATETRYQSFSTGKIALLSGLSALSPGLALAEISHAIKSGKNITGKNSWAGSLFWLFVVIAIADIALDKIPVYAHVHHFVQYLLLFGIVYLAKTSFSLDSSSMLPILTAVGGQLSRQGYHIPIAAATVTTGTPIASTAEDILAFIALNYLLH